jgi:hypothetical protein
MAISLTLFYGSPNAHNGAAASLGSIARANQKLNADNDLVVIESAEAAASFKRNFDARFASGEALPAGAR